MLALLFLIAQLPIKEHHRIWTTPLVASDRWVVLTDAREFGMSAEGVRANYRMASQHATLVRDEVFTYNNRPKIQRWEEECFWRFKCWDLLDDVLNCPYDPATKLQKLYQLRAMLGDEDYFARRMPHPIPSYRR